MTDSMLSIALSGAAAGLGVAMPLGAVGVLLLAEGMRGRRAAAAGALAVATVDMGYAAAAAALGPLIAEPLSAVEAWVRLGAAVVLIVIAGHGLWALRRSGRRGFRPGLAGAVTGGAGESPAAPPAAARHRSPAATFVRFAGLTLLNPATALYFAALTTAQGARLGGAGAAAIFVAGVFVASLVWQQALAAAGALAGTRLAARTRLVTHALGYGLVAGYAVVLALPLPGAPVAR